jgi:hypothetical protein
MRAAYLVPIQDPRFGAVEFVNNVLDVVGRQNPHGRGLVAVDLVAIPMPSLEEMLVLVLRDANKHYRLTSYRHAMACLKRGEIPPNDPMLSARAVFEAAHEHVTWAPTRVLSATLNLT